MLKSTAKKIYVLDTNVLIHDPRGALFAFEDNDIVLSIRVFEEFDGLKMKQGDSAFSAREASRQLENLTEGKDVNKGIKLPKGGILTIEYNGHDYSDLPYGLEHNVDNILLVTAMRLGKDNPKKKIILVSKDINVRLKARACGIAVEDYHSDQVNVDDLHTDVLRINDDEEGSMTNLIYRGGNKVPCPEGLKLFPNQCCRIVSSQRRKTTLACYDKASNSLRLVLKPEKLEMLGLKPKNNEQALAYHLAINPNIDLVSLIGPAGTGKTLMALLAGYHQLDGRNNYEKIIVFRPTKEIGDELGFLPGSLEEKMRPWVRPIKSAWDLIIEHSSEKDVSMSDFEDQQMLDVLPINHLRGDTLHRAFIIVDEAQNLSPHQIKTAITRVGEGSKMILTGDLGQIDTPYLDPRSSGLTKTIHHFLKYDRASHLALNKCERSPLAGYASLM